MITRTAFLFAYPCHPGQGSRDRTSCRGRGPCPPLEWTESRLRLTMTVKLRYCAKLQLRNVDCHAHHNYSHLALDVKTLSRWLQECPSTPSMPSSFSRLYEGPPPLPRDSLAAPSRCASRPRCMRICPWFTRADQVLFVCVGGWIKIIRQSEQPLRPSSCPGAI